MGKKFILLFLVLTFCTFCGALTHRATDKNASDADIYTEAPQDVCITDQAVLEKLAQTKNLQIPAGYHLECYTQSFYVGNEYVSAEHPRSVEPKLSAFLYRIENVSVKSPSFCYAYEYAHDIYQGPAEISTTFSQSKSAKQSVGVPIGNSTVKAAVGYAVADAYTVSKAFWVTVPDGKYLDVKAYPLYQRTAFDVYHRWTGALVQKEAYADKPIGLLIEQYTYSQ